MENPIIVTIKEVFIILLTLTGLELASLQVVKERFKIQNNTMGAVSLIVGFILSGLVSWYWVDAHKYALELGQWIGVGIAFVIGGLAPSGAYKLIGAFAGVRQQEKF